MSINTKNTFKKTDRKQDIDYIERAIRPTIRGSFNAELCDPQYNISTRTLKFRTNEYCYDNESGALFFSDGVRFWFD